MLTKKKFIFATLIFAISGALLFFSLWSRNNDLAYINLEVVPPDSTIDIDNKSAQPGTLKVKPGDHTITVSKDGFLAQTRSISLSTNETKFLGIALISSSPATKNWYDDHPEDQRLLESISSRSFDQDTSNATDAMPLLKELPFIDLLYRVDYGLSQQRPNDPYAIAIYIKYYREEGKRQALEWLKFKGYEPSELEIIFQRAE